MEGTKEILKLRLINDDIKPDKIKISELTHLLSNYEKALKGIISINKKGVYDERDYYMSLTAIKDDSAGYQTIAYSPDNDFNSALIDLDKITKTKITKNIHPKTVDAVNSMTAWLRTHKCNAEFYYAEEIITKLSKDLTLEKKGGLITEHTTIYGKIIDVGKEVRPRIEIKLLSGKSLNIFVTVDKAIDLGSVLYKYIGLIGKSTINTINYEIESFEIEDYVIINDITNKEKFQSLKKLVGHLWKDIPNPDEYLDNLI